MRNPLRKRPFCERKLAFSTRVEFHEKNAVNMNVVWIPGGLEKTRQLSQPAGFFLLKVGEDERLQAEAERLLSV